MWRCILVVLMFLVPVGTAAGRYFSWEDAGTWLLDEPGGGATIRCASGEETLTLSITLQPTAGAGAIYAIPAPAAAVRFSFVRGASYWRGELPGHVAGEHLANVRLAAQGLEIYPLVCFAFRPSLARSAELPPTPPAALREGGLQCELIDLRTAAELFAAADRAGILIDPAQAAHFAPLVDGHHVFVVLSLTSPQEYLDTIADYQQNNRPVRSIPRSLELRFPAAAPVMPGLLRGKPSVRGTMKIAVVGNWRPVNVPGESRSQVYSGEQLMPTRDGPDVLAAGTPYTRLVVRASDFPEMTFRENRSLPLIASESINAAGWPSFVLGFVILVGGASYLSGGLAGLLVFRRWRLYARLGLWNFLTILAVWHRVGAMDRTGGSAGKARVFTLCFSLLFVGITAMVQIGVSLALGDVLLP